MVRICLLILSTLIAFNCFSQLTTSTAFTPTALVQNVLLGGGVTVSNVTLTGYENAAGSFYLSSPTTIGFQNGVILTTGTVLFNDPYFGLNEGPHGPNNQTGGGVNNQFPGNSLFNGLTSGATYNATILEFDFVPQYDSVKFNYVFASEEYPEYVCSEYNDVFGFFISGPKPSGGNYINQNIAIIPNSSYPVAINTINPGMQGSQGSWGGCTSLGFSNYYLDNDWGNTLQYDGYTKKLTAKAAVKCGQTYHFKIAITDVGDGIYDSGVFLESNSFVSATTLSINHEVSMSTQQSSMNEGCGNTEVHFIRNANSAQYTDTVYVNYSGTAQLNNDYFVSANPSSYIVFPPGQDSVTLTINTAQDVVTEGTESIQLQFTSSVSLCTSQTSTLNLYVVDVQPIVLQTNDVSTCYNQQVQLTAAASGGSNNGIQYAWYSNTGNLLGTNSVFSFTAVQDTFFVVEVGDICAPASKRDTVYVSVKKENYISAVYFDVLTSLNDNMLVEKCDTVNLNLVRAGTNLISQDTMQYVLSGTAVNGLDYTGLSGQVIFAPLQTTQSANFLVPTDYVVEPTESLIVTTVLPSFNQCYLAKASDTLLIKNLDTIQVQTFDTTLCVGETITLTTQASGGYGAYTYLWDAALDSTHIITAVNPSYYVVQVNDACGNFSVIDTFTIHIHYNIPELISVPNDSACHTWDYFFNVNVVNATHPINYTFQTSLSATVLPIQTGFMIDNISGSQIIYVTVTDRCGKTDTDSFYVEVKNCDINLPTIVTNNGDGVNDALYFRNLEYYPNSKLTVFNRWGMKLYETNNYTNDYSPNYSDGTYYYILELPDGKVFPMYFLLIKS